MMATAHAGGRRAVAAGCVTILLIVAVFLVTGSRIAAAQCVPPLCSTSSTSPPTSTTAPPTTRPTPSSTEPATTAPSPTSISQTVATVEAQRSTQSAQPVLPTVEASPTSNPLIVPGPGPGAASAAATSGETPAAKASKGDKTATVVAMVVAGLLVAAILLGLLTYRFWRNTRPLVARTARAPEQGWS